MVTKVHILIFFMQNKDLIARAKIRVQHLTSCKNFSFNPCTKFSVLRLFCPKKRLNRDTKLIAILRRQFCIILTALEENILQYCLLKIVSYY